MHVNTHINGIKFNKITVKSMIMSGTCLTTHLTTLLQAGDGLFYDTEATRESKDVSEYDPGPF